MQPDAFSKAVKEFTSTAFSKGEDLKRLSVFEDSTTHFPQPVQKEN